MISGDTTNTIMPGATVNEDQYEKALSETVRQMRAMDDALHPTKLASGNPRIKGTSAK